MANAILDTFFEESEELLEALAEGLAQMQGGDHDAEVVNSVFRLSIRSRVVPARSR